VAGSVDQFARRAGHLVGVQRPLLQVQLSEQFVEMPQCLAIDVAVADKVSAAAALLAWLVQHPGQWGQSYEGYVHGGYSGNSGAVLGEEESAGGTGRDI